MRVELLIDTSVFHASYTKTEGCGVFCSKKNKKSTKIEHVNLAVDSISKGNILVMD